MLKQDINKLLKSYLEYYHLSDWKGICVALGGDGKRSYSNENTNTLCAKNSIPMDTPIINKPKTKVFSWVNKKGKRITITETYT